MRKYTLRKQIKNRGCFAEIIYDLIVNENEGFCIDCRCSDWVVICNAAGAIFYDYFKRLRVGGVKIVVYEINWYPIDTNNLIVLFACLQAFAEATDVFIDNLKIDTDLGMFCLPEARGI
ncbi:hypothetical protein [Chitinophaga sp. sic0106]|uniref:hypothetical protein n=1 Tax=Chitinophaga sp. sic0106 TaxID=2854785 RepID=UPI001C4478F9|nr:hypothetical protein [Chitinophaga sp. sic0106]MBV7531767.1 hypothetical protein [Chitinophaga sp. sic0106]